MQTANGWCVHPPYFLHSSAVHMCHESNNILARQSVCVWAQCCMHNMGGENEEVVQRRKVKTNRSEPQKQMHKEQTVWQLGELQMRVTWFFIGWSQHQLHHTTGATHIYFDGVSFAAGKKQTSDSQQEYFKPKKALSCQGDGLAKCTFSTPYIQTMSYPNVMHLRVKTRRD